MKQIDSISALLKKTNISIGIKEDNDVAGKILDVRLDLIEFDPEQPRQDILEEEIDDIVRTLQPEGSKINQPITTWPKNEHGKYLVKFGEKRTRASRIAGRTTIPVIIDDRYDYKILKHRAFNFAEQYVENNARGGLTNLDDCVALLKLKQMFGNLKDVVKFTGAVSQGTVSDKIKVSEIKTNPEYSFLLEFYNDDSLKFKDLTNLRKIIETFRRNESHFEQIKQMVVFSVKEGVFNRKWVETLSTMDFKQQEPIKAKVNSKSKENISDENHNIKITFKTRPVKKASITGRVNIDRRKKKCTVVLERVDNEDGYVWVIIEGSEEPIRVSLSKFTLTGIT